MFLVARNERSNLGTPNEVKVAPKNQNSLYIYSILLGEGVNLTVHKQAHYYEEEGD